MLYQSICDFHSFHSLINALLLEIEHHQNNLNFPKRKLEVYQ